MTVWDFLDKHSKALAALTRIVLAGVGYLVFANDPSFDEARYMLLFGGGELLTSRFTRKGE